jgi:hypothetical protein
MGGQDTDNELIMWLIRQAGRYDAVTLAIVKRE